MKLFGPFSEIRILDKNKRIKSDFTSIDFPLKEGGIVVEDSKIIDIGDFSLLYSKYRDKEIEIEEIEEQQVLMLFDINL